MKLRNFLLLPISFLYGFIISLRNLFYDYGVFSSQGFNLPIISVGNLSVGGTGKTPHVEYLITLLSKRYKVATLSRGYGRVTKGFIKSTQESTATEIGDEPFQLKSKFQNVNVYLDEQRVRGIKNIIAEKENENLNAILLDDAFQHRSVQPSINILLTPYYNQYYKDFVMPSGSLREWRSGASRADIIIVTKTPDIFSPLERRIITQDINPKPHQQVFFSYLKYGNFVPLKKTDEQKRKIDKEFYFTREFTCLLLTGIANPEPLKTYLGEKFFELKHIGYSDHHMFSEFEIEQLKGTFESIKNQNKIIITTEKDAARLQESNILPLVKDLPLFYITIEVDFHNKDKEAFDNYILSYVGRN